MFLFKKYQVVAAFSIISLLFFSDLFAANIYVDKTLTSPCSGNYNIDSRSCTGGANDAYKSVQTAINSMNPGDHIVLRGGTYNECIDIPTSKNGSSWDEGSYNKLESCNSNAGCFPNEWAILDGNSSCSANNGAVLGHIVFEEDGRGDIKYWMLERLEITGGGGNNTAYGFWGNGGPFWIRNNYIHDNVAANCNNLPAGTFGHLWHDSIIEYNWYADNAGTDQHNCKQMGWISSYSNSTSVADNMDFGTAVIDKSNVIQYNLVEGGNVGIGVKHFALYTGRNTVTGHDYEDTYEDYGTDIHHNIVRNTAGYAIGAHGDFWQVHNNIIENSAENAVLMQYTYPSYWNLYKVAVYNNTIINTNGSPAILGYGLRMGNQYNADDYKYIFNNIVDQAGTAVNYGREGIITAQFYKSGDPVINIQNHIISNNYIYRANEIGDYRLIRDTSYYTSTELENQTTTAAPRVAYKNTYDSGNLLYKGTNGADKYLTLGGHQVEPGVTIANGGIGGAHPNLAGITIPSYLGATNPQDDKWVSGVLSFSNKVAGIPIKLRDAISGQPIWQVSPPNPPTIVQ